MLIEPIMTEPDICIIVATDRHGGFSNKNEIPWRIPKDLLHFRQITTHTELPKKRNAVIMGRKTFETTGVLKNRINIVLSQKPINTKEPITGHYYHCYTMDAAVELAKQLGSQTIFIIGGERVYKEAIEKHPVNTIYRTRIDSDYICDRFFPDIASLPFTCIEQTYGGKDPNDGLSDYWFQIWKRCPQKPI